MSLRRVLVPAALLLLVVLVPGAGANPIEVENAQRGSRGWDPPAAPPGDIQGYASESSVEPGGRIGFHVASTSRYRISIYRLGWYGGMGGRRLACLPSCRGAGRPAVAQPALPAPDPKTGVVSAGWAETDALRIPARWRSGYYVAVLRPTAGPSVGRGLPLLFIVRQAPGARASILVQASVNTWQAYFNGGGKSLYDFNSTGRRAATKVSFDRPQTAQKVGDHLYDRSQIVIDLRLMRFLERRGFDVAYQTDVDTDRDPSSLLRPSFVIVNGHSEYWTRRMRDGFDAARDAGQDLMFAGANIGVWQIRYDDGYRSLVEYRVAAADPERDPQEKTVYFRFLQTPRPECRLLGVAYHLEQPKATPATGNAFVVQANPRTTMWMRGTGLARGDQLPATVGYEWDSEYPGCLNPPATRVFHAPGVRPASFVTFRTGAGGRVMSWGSLFFGRSLDTYGLPYLAEQPRLQRYLWNALSDMGGRRGRPDRCLRRSGRLAGGGIGRVRVGLSRRDVVRRAGRPASRTSPLLRWCTDDGSEVFALIRGDRVIAVGTTGQSVRSGRVRVGRRPPAGYRRTPTRGVYRMPGRTPVLFGLESRRVSWIAVASPRKPAVPVQLARGLARSS